VSILFLKGRETLALKSGNKELKGKNGKRKLKKIRVEIQRISIFVFWIPFGIICLRRNIPAL